MISAGERPAEISMLLAAKVDPQMQAVSKPSRCQNIYELKMKPETAASVKLETAASMKLETAAGMKPETAAGMKPETAASMKPETAASMKPVKVVRKDNR